MSERSKEGGRKNSTLGWGYPPGVKNELATGRSLNFHGSLLLSLSLLLTVSLSSSGELKISSCYKITWQEMLTLAGL